MSSLFDSAQPIEPRRDHRSYRPEGDPFADIPGADISVADDYCPDHKAAIAAAQKLRKDHEYDWRKRALKWMAERGVKGFPVDRYNHKAERSFDLWALWDLAGVSLEGRAEFVQFTARSIKARHLMKMCSHEPVGKFDTTWRVDHLHDLLDRGVPCYLLLFYQQGSTPEARKGRPWLFDVLEITEEVVAQYEPRRVARK